MDILIEKMTAAHWPAVREIYAIGIATKNATFEQQPPTWDVWHKSHWPDGRFVAIDKNSVLGWAALSPVSNRCVYAGVAEVSLYVSDKVWGKGIGTLLLERLIAFSEEEGIWTLQAGIFPENAISIKLHKKLGFRRVGIRKKIGCMNGVWRDVILFERRSKRIGCE